MLRLSFCLMVVLLFPATNVAAGDKLHVVTMLAPPRIMVIDDVITGMAADLAKEALARAGYDAVIQLVPWKRAVYMASTGLADALFYPLYTEERAKVFHYPATPLFSIDLVALRRADADIVIRPGYKGLRGLVLGVGRGFVYGPKALKLIDRAHFKKVESTASNDLGFRKLLDNRIDMLLMDRTLAQHFLNQPATLGKADYVRDEQGRIAILDSKNGYMVFSKRTTSAMDAERFNNALESMKEDGSYQAIISKYQAP